MTLAHAHACYNPGSMNQQPATTEPKRPPRKPRVEFANVPERQQAFLDALASDTCYGVVSWAASEVGIRKQAAYEHAKRDPDFAEEMRLAQEAGAALYKDVHRRHGIEGVVKNRKITRTHDKETGEVLEEVEDITMEYNAKDRETLSRIALREERRDPEEATKRMEVTHKVYHSLEQAYPNLDPDLRVQLRGLLEEHARRQDQEAIDVESTPVIEDSRDAV